MAGRASIVGAAATHVGKVREHNEDSHHFDGDLGMFVVCDGMGGHAAGEVASALAVRTIRTEWANERTAAACDAWLERGNPEAKKALLGVIRAGVIAAHDAIIAEADRDEAKSGMGTTLVGALIVGGELVFAHAGDSRAYLVRDGISMQLTEDHTLLSRLLAAGIDVDVSGEGSRFRSMLTNALGIGQECKVSTFVVPLADGDRFLLCSDGISEYVPENEVGEVLTKQPSPARAAQRLIDLALERGGGDNATAVVVRVLEAGETPLPAEQRKRDDAAIHASPLWGGKVTPQQRLRALRIAIPRDHAAGDKLPAHALGDRVAWIIVEGDVVQDGASLAPGALVYPESLTASAPPIERDGLAFAKTDVRALAIRADDFRELCDDDSELGEALMETLGTVLASRLARVRVDRHDTEVDPHAHTNPAMAAVSPADAEAETKPEYAPRLAVAAMASATASALDHATTQPIPARQAAVIPAVGGAAVAPSAPPERPTPNPAALKAAVPARIAAVAPARLARPSKIPIPSLPRAAVPAPPSGSIARLPLRPPKDDGDAEQPETIVMSVDDGNVRVTETVIETDSETITITTVTEAPEVREALAAAGPRDLHDDEPTRTRAITADDGAAVSGTIAEVLGEATAPKADDAEAEADGDAPAEPESTSPTLPQGSRKKRISDGWDEG